MLKITTIIERDQIYKACFIKRNKKINQGKKKIDEAIIQQGKYYDKNMSDIFFQELNIPKPKYYLGVGGGFMEKIQEE